MPDYIAPVLRPLVDRLRARYPGIRIPLAELRKRDDGVQQQSITYQAQLDDLKRCGVLTGEMAGKIREKDILSGYASGDTALGDSFSMSQGLYCYSRPGCWDLHIYTGSAPRERKRIGTSRARAALRRIFKSRSPA